MIMRDPKFSIAALYRCLRQLDNPSFQFKPKGRPRTVKDEQEKLIVEKIKSAQLTLSQITNDIIVRESISIASKIESCMIFFHSSYLTQFQKNTKINFFKDETENDAVSRLKRMGGKTWLTSFTHLNKPSASR